MRAIDGATGQFSTEAEMRSALNILILFGAASWLSAQESQPPREQQPRVGRSQRQQEPERERGVTTQISLSGEVLLETGYSPEEPVRVDLLCGGTVFRQTFTFSRGQFSFELGSGSASSVFGADVSSLSAGLSGARSNAERRFEQTGGWDFGAQGPGSVFNLAGCEITANLPGYQSERIHLTSRSTFDGPDIGTVVLHRLSGVEATTISLNTLAAPAKAVDRFRKAVQELQKSKPDLAAARKDLDRAIRLYPEFAAAWNLLGEIELQEENPREARRCFDEAVKADARYLKPYSAILRLEISEKNWTEVVRLAKTVSALNPHMMEAHYFHGLGNYFLEDFDEAIRSLQIVQESDAATQFFRTHHVLGDIYARRGELESAAEQLNLYLSIAPEGDPVAPRLQQLLGEWHQQGWISSPGQRPGE